MNEALQTLEVKVENNGTTPQGEIFAREWNVLVEAVKALDLKEFDEAKLLQFLRDNDFITSEDIPDVDFSNVVTLSGQQTIPGAKDFVGGIKVNGMPIIYNTELGVWEFTGDLLVTGAVTMFGSLSSFKPSTITDAVLVDGETIVKTKNSQGQWQLTAIGRGGGTGGGISAAEVNILINNALKPYALSTSIPTDNKQLSNGAGYATVGDLDTRINNLINGAPAAYDTLKEIADVLAGNINSIGDILTALDTKATKTYVDGELAKYILKDTTQDISARHNFVDGLQIGGLPITKSASANNTIYLDANLVVSGAITMFGKDSTTFPTIWANIPFNLEHMSWDGSQWNIKGGGGSGGLDTNAVNVLISEYLAKNSYATISDISSALVGYATQSWVNTALAGYLPKDGTAANATKLGGILSGYRQGEACIPTIGSGGVMEIGKYIDFHTVDEEAGVDYSLRIECQGPYRNRVYFPTTSGKLALTSDIPSLVGYATENFVNTALAGYLTLSGGTLTDALTVKGSGSPLTVHRTQSLASVVKFVNTDGNLGWLGVDVDKTAIFMEASGVIKKLLHSGNYSDYSLPITGGVVNGSITAPSFIGNLTGNADSATKLQTLCTIWGQSFDGTDDIIGSPSFPQYININRNAATGAIMNPSLLGCEIEAYSSHIAFKSYSSDGGGISSHLCLIKGGNVAIGSTEAIEKLTVHGNILATGAITMFSQLSLKNVLDYDGLSLEQLSLIKPARFTWKDGRDSLVHAGGIADEVMRVLPEVVYKTSDDKLTMDYGSAGFFMAASLIKPVIDHEKRIEELEREVEYLKNENKQLRAS